MNVTVQPLDRKRVNPDDFKNGPVEIHVAEKNMERVILAIAEHHGLAYAQRLLKRQQVAQWPDEDFADLCLELRQWAIAMGWAVPFTPPMQGRSAALQRGIHCKACDKPLGDNSDPELCPTCMSAIHSILEGIYGKDESSELIEIIGLPETQEED